MKDNWSEMLIPGKLASRLIRGKNSVNSTIGRKSLSELTEDPTYASPTYPRFTVYILYFIKFRVQSKKNNKNRTTPTMIKYYI